MPSELKLDKHKLDFFRVREFMLTQTFRTYFEGDESIEVCRINQVPRMSLLEKV